MLNSKFALNEDENVQIEVLIYYSLSTLSTIGLGDFHPITEFERLMSVFVLLFGGVLIFSYCLG